MESAGTAHHAILDKSVPQSWRLPNTMPLLGDERPNGLFHTLQAGTTTFGSTAMQVQRGKVPGYTGHLPGLKHTFGSTYGSMEPSMPSDPPKATHKFHVVTDGQIKAPDSLPPASRGRIPGYTGHVPKQLRTYGVTYGTMDSRSALTA